MISEPIALTVSGEAYALARINQDNYAAEYFDLSAAGTERFTFNVKHTLPNGSQVTESHLIRCDLEHLDADGLVERTDSAWVVLKTAGAAQNTAALLALFTGLVNALSASSYALVNQVLTRQS